MLRTTNEPGKTPDNEAAFHRALKSRRVQQIAGLLPDDERTGYMLIGVCDQCGSLAGGNIMLVCGRGDTLKWSCGCGEPQEHVLGDEYPLAPVGGSDR